MEQHPKYNEVKAYLAGGLSEEDEKVFEKNIQQDEALATEVHLQKVEREAIERMISLELKEKIKKWEESPPPNPFEEGKTKKSNTSLKWIIWIMASVVIFFGVRQIFFLPPPNEAPSIDTTKEISPPFKETKEKKDIPIANTKKPKDSKRPQRPNIEKEKFTPKKKNYLAQAIDIYHKTPKNFAFSARSADEIKEKSTMEKAIEAYTQQRFSVAKTLMGEPTDNEENEMVYFRGHVYFNLKSFADAATQFETIVKQEEIFVAKQEEAKWYLLLSYLAQYPNEKANFEALATKLASEEFFYKKKELLKLQTKMN